MTTIAQLLAQRARLQPISDSAALDVEVLLCHCLRKDRSYLRAWPEAEVNPALVAQFEALLERRAAGEPIAYLTGTCGFWTLELAVHTSTLIPRPETELLVEQGLRVLAGCEGVRVLDLGTGTGAVALALAAEHPDWQVLAGESQPEAVRLAQHNRARLQLDNVQVIASDWYAQLPSQRFHLIVSNPPYVAAEDPHLAQGDVRFEPASALVAAKQGFEAIERIIAGASEHLVDGGWLLFEHGYQQGAGARERLQAAGFTAVFTARDLAGHERVSGGRYTSEQHTDER